MTADEAIKKLAKIHDRDWLELDEEADHQEADRILCDLLMSLGYGAVVSEWLKVQKWYA